MATQQTLNAAIAKLQTAMSTVTCNTDTATYWNNLIARKLVLHSNGTVQSTCSNPLAYFLVPLAGDGTRGRSHNFTLDQFVYALSQGWTKDADKRLRGVNESAIKAGLAYAKPRQDSVLGSVEGRLAATMISAQSNVKTRQQGSREVIKLENAKQEKNRAAFENATLTLAALIEKYGKNKPEMVKPEVAKKGKPKAA